MPPTTDYNLESTKFKDQHLSVGSVVFAPFPGKDPLSEPYYWGKITRKFVTRATGVAPTTNYSVRFHDGDMVKSTTAECLHRGEEALALMKTGGKGGISPDLPPPEYMNGCNIMEDVADTSGSGSGSGNAGEDRTTTQLPVPSSSPRRSGRDRVTTTITIDGHTVLRQNNYTVRGNEYIWGSDADADKPKEPKAKKPKVGGENKQARAYKPSVAEVARSFHNDAISKASQPKAAYRWAFLAQHVDLLERFCETAVLDRLRQVPTSAAVMPTPVQEQPKAILATLRDYQMEGLNFMVRMYQKNLPCILGDEMGLGKTLQTIALLCHLKEHEGANGPSLVICPLSVLSSWSNELQKWAPSLNVFRLHTSTHEDQLAQKKEINDNAVKYDVILTTYEMAKIPALKSMYQRLHFNYLVLDEGHKIKGHQTHIAQAVRKIHRGNSLLLTGTPLQNNLVELWSLLNFLYPEVFTTSDPFEAAFDLKENIIDKEFLKHSQKLLDLFMLRRLKAEVETLMPKKLETKVYCPLSKIQSFWYKQLLLKDLTLLERCENAENGEIRGSTHTVLRNLFMQLRKCCNHPFTVDKRMEVDPSATSLEDLVAASGKLSVLDMLLQSLCKKGHRSVLFSQFTLVLDIIEDYCILRGWKYCRLDGGVSRARRNYDIRRFNEPDSPYFLFLVSTRSGGMGLNLQSADTCILFDSDWNPQSDIQAMGRVHRIGQTKTVHVYRLVSSGTIEERILERAEKKLLLEVVNRETKNGDEMVDDTIRNLSAQELFKDIKFGSQAVFGNKSNELPSWDDIDTITDRSRKEGDSAGNLTGGAALSADTFDAEKAFTETQIFDGKDFKKIRDAMKKKEKSLVPKSMDGIAHLWKEISSLSSKRVRKSRIVQVEGVGTGYGKATVPVLASNNYELQNGESSVFDRELSHSKKERFEVKKKRKTAVSHGNQDFCQNCGDGGSLVLCPRCPCSLHLKCCGLRSAKDFLSCTHHRCTSCSKSRAGAGGLLYPCHACAHSFCEDCLPQDVTFLNRVERFDKMGFDSASKHIVYVNCSKSCEKVAKRELGYVPPSNDGRRQLCPEPLDLAFNFGGAYDVEKEKEKIENAKTETLTQTDSRPRRAAASVAMSKVKKLANRESWNPGLKAPRTPMAMVAPLPLVKAKQARLEHMVFDFANSKTVPVTFPPGPYLMRLKPTKEGYCQVDRITSPDSKVHVGDILAGLNGVPVPRSQNIDAWIPLFRVASQGPSTITLLRPVVRIVASYPPTKAIQKATTTDAPLIKNMDSERPVPVTAEKASCKPTQVISLPMAQSRGRSAVSPIDLLDDDSTDGSTHTADRPSFLQSKSPISISSDSVDEVVRDASSVEKPNNADKVNTTVDTEMNMTTMSIDI